MLDFVRHFFNLSLLHAVSVWGLVVLGSLEVHFLMWSILQHAVGIRASQFGVVGALCVAGKFCLASITMESSSILQLVMLVRSFVLVMVRRSQSGHGQARQN
jgi:hypothetical protein